jgi:hypothetical protein
MKLKEKARDEKNGEKEDWMGREDASFNFYTTHGT